MFPSWCRKEWIAMPEPDQPDWLLRPWSAGIVQARINLISSDKGKLKLLLRILLAILTFLTVHTMPTTSLKPRATCKSAQVEGLGMRLACHRLHMHSPTLQLSLPVSGKKRACLSLHLFQQPWPKCLILAQTTTSPIRCSITTLDVQVCIRFKHVQMCLRVCV